MPLPPPHLFRVSPIVRLRSEPRREEQHHSRQDEVRQTPIRRDVSRRTTNRSGETEASLVTTRLPTDLHITAYIAIEVASNPHSPMKGIGG